AVGLERLKSGYRESDPGLHHGKVMRCHCATSAWSLLRELNPDHRRTEAACCRYHQAGVKLGAQGSNLKAPGSKPGGSASSPTTHREPPSGADPDLPPYRSGAAAVRGGEVPSAGFEPALARLSSWCLCHWATRAQSRHPVSTRISCLTRARSQ